MIPRSRWLSWPRGSTAWFARAQLVELGLKRNVIARHLERGRPHAAPASSFTW